MGRGFAWRPGLGVAAAAAGALLAGAPAPAQVQGACPSADAGVVDQGYHFKFDSFERKGADGRRKIVYCVVNLHRSRNVWVDWPDAGLKGWVPAGQRGGAVTGPGTRPVGFRTGFLWYGSRPRRFEVSTAVFAAGPAPAGTFAAGRPALIRAAFQGPPAAEAESSTSTGSIYVPLTSAVAPFLALFRPTGAQAAAQPMGRKIFRLLIRHLEKRPEALVPFEMAFTTERPAAPGGPALRYSCTYRGAPGVLLRFDDPRLHRTMFGSEGLFRAGAQGPATMRSAPVAAPAGVERRAGNLQILLPDGATVIGSIGFDYLAPVPG